MKIPVYLGIAIRIILLVGFGMLFTFITPELRIFFGDRLATLQEINSNHADFQIDILYVWGARHYWYFWGVFLLFILSLINFIMSIVSLINKHYPNTL